MLTFNRITKKCSRNFFLAAYSVFRVLYRILCVFCVFLGFSALGERQDLLNREIIYRYNVPIFILAGELTE